MIRFVPLLPSRRFAALIALAGLAFLAGTAFAIAIDTLLLLIAAADAVALYRLPIPFITRTIPPRIALGGTTDVLVELRNSAAVERHVVWTDDPGPGLTREGVDVFTNTLPPLRTVQQSYRVHGAERGRTSVGDVHMRLRGPLGLLWRRVVVTHRDAVIVQPGMRELQRHRVLALHHRLEIGQRRVREVGEGREFERLREYARGDDPRRIDWKATARRSQTIVRQYEAERSQSMVIAIDAGRLMSERFGGRERLDHALAAALVLADAAGIYGDGVGVLLFADTVQAFLPPSRHPLWRIADVLASVEARRVEPDYPGAFRYLGRQLRRRSLVVVFSDIIDARASAALLEYLGVTARRHLPLIVALRNPELDAASVAAITEEPAAYHRAAAEELLQARAVALAAVRRRGVLSLDVRPEMATGETLSRYLAIKRRGLL